MPTEVTHDVTLPRFHYLVDGEVCNADRAAMVGPLVEAFAATYYGDGNALDGADGIDMVVSDMICDIGHWWLNLRLCHATDDERTICAEEPTVDGFNDLLERAWLTFVEEHDDEQEFMDE